MVNIGLISMICFVLSSYFFREKTVMVDLS